MVAEVRKRRGGNPKYGDEFKASSVLMLQAAGYPERPNAMRDVERATGVHRKTLLRWWRNETGAPPEEVVERERLNLLEEFEKLIGISLGFAAEAAEVAGYKDLLIGIGILFDKRQLLQGEPTAIMKDATDARELLASRIASVSSRAREKGSNGHVNGGGGSGASVRLEVLGEAESAGTGW